MAKACRKPNNSNNCKNSNSSEIPRNLWCEFSRFSFLFFYLPLVSVFCKKKKKFIHLWQKCMTKTASSGTHREALSRLPIAAIPPSTYKRVKLDIQYKIICTIVLFYCLKFIMLYSLGTEIQCLEWDTGIFGFGHFLGWFFGFVVCCSFQFFRCLASCFSAFWQK